MILAAAQIGAAQIQSACFDGILFGHDLRQLLFAGRIQVRSARAADRVGPNRIAIPQVIDRIDDLPLQHLPAPIGQRARIDDAVAIGFAAEALLQIKIAGKHRRHDFRVTDVSATKSLAW